MTRALSHLVLAVVLVLLTVAAYAFFYLRIEEMRASIATTEAEIVAKSDEALRIREAQGALASLTEDEARVKAYFISTDEIVGFLEDIGEEGEAIGSAVEVVSVTQEKAVGTHARVSLALRITGSFNAVLRTVGALEYGPYDATITNLTLDTSPIERDTGGWVATVTYSVGTQTKTP